MSKYVLKTIPVIFAALFVLSACSANSNENLKTGKCVVVPPEKPVACTMQYDPVCGCDGKTYSNACMARGAGVPSSTPGACEEENPNT